MHFGLYHKPDGALANLSHALPMAGHRVTWRRPNVFHANEVEPFDAVVVLGLRGQAEVVRQAYRARGVPVVVVDVAHLRRELGFRRYALDSLQWLPPFPCPPDRFEALGVELQPRREGEAVLVCGQTPGDAAHGMDAEQLREWAEGVFAKLRQHTQRPLVWRPHPAVPNLRVDGADRTEDPGEVALFDGDYHAVVTHSSTAGLEALAAGLPVFCDPSAFYAECASTDLAGIEDPAFPSDEARAGLFARVAYAQWTDDEVRSGVAVDWLLDCLAGRKPEPVAEAEAAPLVGKPAVNLVALVGPRAAAALEDLGGLEAALAMPEEQLAAARYVGPKTLAALRELRAA